MEFQILDGRYSFYQWDANRKLLVLDAAVEQVHFVSEEGAALVCAVYEEDGQRVVDVPNILLQREGWLIFFAVARGCTLYSRRFQINGREKPEDYIYTPTEVLSVERVAERVVEEALQSGAFLPDLSDYVKNTNIATTTKVGLVACGSGLQISSSTGKISIYPASDTYIQGKTTDSRVITPGNLDYAVKVGLCENKNTMAQAEKLAACCWLGTALITANEDGSLSLQLADGTYRISASKEA